MRRRPRNHSSITSSRWESREGDEHEHPRRLCRWDAAPSETRIPSLVDHPDRARHRAGRVRVLLPVVLWRLRWHLLRGWPLAGGMVIGGIAWIVGVIRGVLKRRTPSGDPLNLQLHACGDPATVACELEQEFAGQTFRPKRVYVGGHWLCFEHKTQVTVRRIDALVWAHVERVRHKLNGVTPMGTTNQLIVWSRDGRGAAIPLKRKAADEALKTLQAAAPWIFAGYSEALKESWNNDRDDFIALVDEARRQNGRAAPQDDPH